MKTFGVAVVENVIENYFVEATSADEARRIVWASLTTPEVELPSSGSGGGSGDPEIIDTWEADSGE